MIQIPTSVVFYAIGLRKDEKTYMRLCFSHAAQAAVELGASIEVSMEEDVYNCEVCNEQKGFRIATTKGEKWENLAAEVEYRKQCHENE